MIREIALVVSMLTLVLGVLLHGFGLIGGVSYLFSGGRDEGDIIYGITLLYSVPLFVISVFCAFVSREFWPRKYYLAVYVLSGAVILQLFIAVVNAMIQ